MFLISVIYSGSIGTSYYSFWIFLTIISIVNLAPNFIDNDEFFTNGIVLLAFVCSVITIVYKLFLPDLFPSGWTDNIFVQNWGHSYIADLLVLSVPIVLLRTTYSPRLPKSILLFIILFAITTTNSRSAIISLSIGTILLKSPSIFQKTLKIIVLLILGSGLFYTLFYANNLKSFSGSRPEYWSQAITAFQDSPLVGKGPGTFGNTNRLYRNDISNSTNYAHNSLLEYLSGNGILFTAILFACIIYGLWFQFHHHHLFFIIGTTSLINSFFDPSWSSPGIFILSLIIIFWGIAKKTTPAFISILFLATFTFFISKTFSDILFLQKKYQLSLILDPFNPNSLNASLPLSANQAIKFYKNDPMFYDQLANLSQLPDNESYYHQIMALDPHGSVNQHVRLLNYYKDKDIDKIYQVLKSVKANLNFDYLTQQQRMIIAKSFYTYALHLWETDRKSESINYFHDATIFSENWSHFYIEEANALWNIGKKDEAQALISIDCLQIPLSTLHCQEYQRLHPIIFPPPSTYKGGIDAIDISKLSPDPPHDIPQNF